MNEQGVSDKSKVAAALLCFFLGTLGIHRFYLGRVGSGIAMLLLTIIGGLTVFFIVGYVLIGIAELWAVIDFFRILFNGLTDSQKRKLR